MIFSVFLITFPTISLLMDTVPIRKDNDPAVVVVWSKNKRGKDFEDRFMYKYCPNKGHVFGVFDGHDGSKTSDYLAHNVFSLFTQQNQGDVCANMSNALLAADKAVKEFYDGSTATVVNILGSKCHFAQVGDSRAVLGSIASKSGPTINFSTKDHEPKGDELTRVLAAGGDLSETGYVYADKYALGGLAMTRAIGDYDCDPEKRVFIATPECATQDISDISDEGYLVIATDGLWDDLSNQDVFRTIHSGIAAENSLSRITKRLVASAIRKGSPDDITCILVKLSALVGDKKASVESIDITELTKDYLSLAILCSACADEPSLIK